MRADASQYDFVAEPTLTATLKVLAEGRHTPLAGGTELMVAFNAGRLPRRPLLSIGHLRELRFLHVEAGHVEIGSGTTFTDLRRHAIVSSKLPLLAQAASWTGSIANQNRATLGGNLVNASPAADSPPALLCHGASIRLISHEGTRTLPYDEFHLGYKRTALRPDELVHSVTVPFPHQASQGFIRKVGPRNAQAISKVALAMVARTQNRILIEIRIAAASLRDTPMRCRGAENALLGQSISAASIAAARTALADEARPIDDIRSTAAYRTAVAGNLLEEFLLQLG